MNNKFGDRLKQIRLDRNMSQEELAQLLGTSKQVISRYEKNQRTPKITVANEYANKLDVPLNTLLGDDSVQPDKDITFDDFTYALHAETQDLTEENKQKLLEMARLFKLSQEHKDK
ncbi:helix-turn-helix transcriptional regulator [Clostridium sp. KNHs216]|uniref:helix-turn-helix domain-containing protein n=1 Tax=Clostridium sp. KNHs216 TaxID=1550235 RepID=UPI0011535705|nr:helix-turn-helix transcriptional regulator [Clostridium sp. KNHs216]TQI66226.1 helix-turn-helix protein [Clostridium sp. KNHs216]